MLEPTSHLYTKIYIRQRFYTSVGMDHRPKCKTQNYKTPKVDTGGNLDELGFGAGILDIIPKA